MKDFQNLGSRHIGLQSLGYPFSLDVTVVSDTLQMRLLAFCSGYHAIHIYLWGWTYFANDISSKSLLTLSINFLSSLSSYAATLARSTLVKQDRASAYLFKRHASPSSINEIFFIHSSDSLLLQPNRFLLLLEHFLEI